MSLEEGCGVRFRWVVGGGLVFLQKKKEGEGGWGGWGVRWGPAKEPASQCARICQNYPLASYPFSFPQVIRRGGTRVPKGDSYKPWSSPTVPLLLIEAELGSFFANESLRPSVMHPKTRCAVVSNSGTLRRGLSTPKDFSVLPRPSKTLHTHKKLRGINLRLIPLSFYEIPWLARHKITLGMAWFSV